MLKTITPGKKYKFLKTTRVFVGSEIHLPIDVEAGTEFVANVDGGYAFDALLTTRGVPPSQKGFARSIANQWLNIFIEDGRVEYSDWIPEAGTVVFYISRDMTIKSKAFNQSLAEAFEAGNLFETEEVANTVLVKVKKALNS